MGAGAPPATPPRVEVQGFQRDIAKALDEAYDRVLDEERKAVTPLGELDVETAQVIVFSDQHKGVGNRADDFRDCERAYNAALAFYFTAGHTLIELGDVEELWEELPGPITKRYEHSLRLSARFQAEGRYFRFWGNHDDMWRDAGPVKTHLHPIYGDGLMVREGMRFRVVNGGAELGHLFLVHGHQGTAESDRLGEWSRIPVRFAWRPLQRAFGFSINTPAKDWELRQQHNIAMHAWADGAAARARTKIVLITGHTHRPVFLSKSDAERLEEQLRAAEEALARNARDPALRRTVAELSADLEWSRGQDRGDKGPEGDTPRDPKRPCYFNTGCCCFADADITGLEIAGGEIRLVRWPDDEEAPRPQILARQRLVDVFAAVQGP
jgi:hypothetical protein